MNQGHWYDISYFEDILFYQVCQTLPHKPLILLVVLDAF